MKKTRRMPVDTLLANYVQQFAGLKQQIQQVQYFCKGTVLKRMMKCGQQRCACHKDPTKRHGPYFEWTLKRKAKRSIGGFGQKKPPFTAPQHNNTASSNPF